VVVDEEAVDGPEERANYILAAPRKFTPKRGKFEFAAFLQRCCYVAVRLQR